MNLANIAHFLWPAPGEVFQATFLVLMVLLVLATVIGVGRSARESNWEFNYNGGRTGGSHLEVEHGSVEDISTAVATRWERVAEFMPGTLLMVGLLGTFVALGIALNDAATILHGARPGASGAVAGDLSGMLGMLDGLGSKFKTSTWGILGYLALRVWATFSGFEERRLGWCIRQMKSELKLRRDVRKREEMHQHGEILTVLRTLANSAEVTAKATSSTDRSMNTFVQSNASTLAGLQASAEAMGRAAASIGNSADKLEKSASELGGTVANFGGEVSSVLDHVKKELTSAIETFTRNTQDRMAGISADLRTATDGISSAISEMRDELTQIIKSMDRSFKDSIAALNSSQREASGLVKAALDQLSMNLASTQQQVESAMLRQSKVQEEFVLGTQASTEATHSTRLGLEKVSTDIQKALANVAESHLTVKSLNSRYASVGEMTQATQAAVARLVAVLEGLPTDLVETLNNRYASVGEMAQATQAAIAQLVAVVEGLSAQVAHLAEASKAGKRRGGSLAAPLRDPESRVGDGIHRKDDELR